MYSWCILIEKIYEQINITQIMGILNITELYTFSDEKLNYVKILINSLTHLNGSTHYYPQYKK